MTTFLTNAIFALTNFIDQILRHTTTIIADPNYLTYISLLRGNYSAVIPDTDCPIFVSLDPAIKSRDDGSRDAE